MQLPEVPAAVLDSHSFSPSQAWADWMMLTFVSGKGKLVNPDHQHLNYATVGVLLAGVENLSKGKRVLGTCQLGAPTGKPWQEGQREQQITEWFGMIPTFIITLEAAYLSTATPSAICALCEHELYHAGQDLDRFGQPKENEDGTPRFAIKPHDVEEFLGVIKRYRRWDEDSSAVADAFAQAPLFSDSEVLGLCGCGARL